MKARQYRRRGQETTTLTKAVTHIRLSETNACKLAALDALAPVYQVLCQEYVTYFCTEEAPDKFHDPIFLTPLSERWHRVAIQQAAGIARSWRTNREQAYQSYLEEMENYLEMVATPDARQKEPEWKQWKTSTHMSLDIYVQFRLEQNLTQLTHERLTLPCRKYIQHF